MRRVYGVWLLTAGIVTLTLLGDVASAQTFYWDRTLSKGRVYAKAQSDGSGLNAMGQPTMFSSQNVQDSGVVTDTAGPIIQTQTASNNDGLGDAFANGTVIGQLSFNPAGQTTTNGTLGTNTVASVHGGPSGQWGMLSYDLKFVLEAIHILKCSGCAPNPAAKLCTLKLQCGWNWTQGHPHTVVCDWLILGYPGSPVFTSDSSQVIVRYTNPSTGYPTELRSDGFWNPASGIYVDIPGTVPVDTSITWISSQGTGTDTAREFGSFGTYGNATVNGGSLVDWLLWMQINN